MEKIDQEKILKYAKWAAIAAAAAIPAGVAYWLWKRKNTVELPACLIDLHLHLDGSLSMESVRELAAMQNIEIPEDDEELKKLLTVSEGCRDLNEYLEKFDFPCSLLQSEEALTKAVENLCGELEEQGVIYAEIRFAPQKHCEKGLTQDQVVAAAAEGLRRSNLDGGLILCCMRGDDNHAENMETVETAARYLGQGVCAVDLAGAEALFPTENFRDLFARAEELGVPFTVHAGEADGPESVRTALSFGAKRLGHGVRSTEDEALLSELAESGVTLELCPTSNLNTAIYADMADYPLRKLMETGVRVTVNTDNMSVSGTTVAEEYFRLIDALGLTKDELHTLLLNAANAAFTDEDTRSELISTIDMSF